MVAQRKYRKLLPKRCRSAVSVESMINKNDNKTNDKTITYYFNETDTFSHSICCNDKIATRIMNILFSKILFIIMSLISIPYVIFITFYEKQYQLHQTQWFFYHGNDIFCNNDIILNIMYFIM